MYLMDEEQIRSFNELGFAGPFDLVDIPTANSLTEALSRAKTRMFFWNRVLTRLPLMNKRFCVSRWGTATWQKGIHAVSGDAYHLGADSRIVDRVSRVLGPDVLLCASMLINQRPGAFHSWHTDNEHRYWGGLTVWVALANTSMKNTLRIITRSHRLPVRLPDDLDDELVLAEAQRHDPACQERVLPAEPGQFYLVAGNAWHSTRNSSSKTRYSIIYRYCGPDAEVRWPYRELKSPLTGRVETQSKIPCCLVRGEDRHQKNLLVEPPRP